MKGEFKSASVTRGKKRRGGSVLQPKTMAGIMYQSILRMTRATTTGSSSCCCSPTMAMASSFADTSDMEWVGDRSMSPSLEMFFSLPMMATAGVPCCCFSGRGMGLLYHGLNLPAPSRSPSPSRARRLKMRVSHEHWHRTCRTMPIAGLAKAAGLVWAGACQCHFTVQHDVQQDYVVFCNLCCVGGVWAAWRPTYYTTSVIFAMP